jgi:UPF0716 protein FxsA
VRILLVLFVITPIIEMWLLITVGGVIGALPTIGLVLLTACIGLVLLRHQGMAALLSARQKLHANELPAREIADSLFFAVGGALLLTPGFVTDAIGFACLTPGIRTLLIRFVGQHLLASGCVNIFTSQTAASAEKEDSRVIDGDFERHSK